MEAIRLGFIGAGVMATWAIYPALHLAPIALQAVCDLDEGRARAVANKFGTGRWYTDYRDMWQQEALEAVIIQMGPGPRQQIVREALEAGYHVFIPKPPALSLADAIELADLAQQTNRVVMVNFQRRFSFGISQTKQLMNKPDFGQLTQLFCSYCSGTYDARRRVGYDNPTQAYILDFAIHHLDLARYLGGEVANLAIYHNESKGGMALSVALEFMSGAVGILQLNSQRIWWRNYDRVELTGEGAYIVVDDLWAAKYYTESQNTFTENYSDKRSTELTGDGPALIEFVEAIRAGRTPNASIGDAVQTMRLYQTIYDAVRQGRRGVITLV